MGSIADIASTGLKVAGIMGEAQSKKVAAQIDAMRMETAAEAAKVRAVQLDAQYRDELNQTLSTIDSIRAAQNVNIDSPTSIALQESARERSSRARMTAKSNEKMRAMGHEADAANLRKSSEGFMRAAMIRSLPEVFSAAQNAASTAMSGMKGK